MSDNGNVALRHIEHARECKLIPILRGVAWSQRAVTAGELDLATTRRIPGTFRVLALVRNTGGAREVWR